MYFKYYQIFYENCIKNTTQIPSVNQIGTRRFVSITEHWFNTFTIYTLVM